MIVLTCGVEEGPGAEVVGRIRERHPHHYLLRDACFLVHSQDVADQVAASIGLKGGEQVQGATGVVFKLNGSYAGYATTSLWDWLVQEN